MTLMLESRMPGNWHVRFGGGGSEKYQQWQLVGLLSYAEIELSALDRQCLSQRLASFEQAEQQVVAWTTRRKQRQATIQWRFTAEDASIKLKHLYPLIPD